MEQARLCIFAEGRESPLVVTNFRQGVAARPNRKAIGRHLLLAIAMRPTSNPC